MVLSSPTVRGAKTTKGNISSSSIVGETNIKHHAFVKLQHGEHGHSEENVVSTQQRDTLKIQNDNNENCYGLES